MDDNIKKGLGILRNYKTDDETKNSIINLLEYAVLLGDATDFILQDSQKLSESEDGLIQDIEAMNYQNKIVDRFNKATSDIDEVVKYCIVIANYVIPTQEEILRNWHDNRTN